jgi:hypothetical protein
MFPIVPKDLYDQFQKTFGVKVNAYYDRMTGFDIIKFDEEFLKTPDGISTHDLVVQKYGEAAADLIVKLIYLQNVGR